MSTLNHSQFSVAQMIAKLVSFDTTSHLSNLPIIEFIRDYLSSHGVESTIVPTPDGTKAALYATIGPKTEGGIVLSGHTDVVPVTGQNWASDPFRMVEREARLYGRGTCDMKSFLAIALALVPEFLAQPLTMPIHLAFSYDEEVGCVGVRPLIAHVLEHFPKPKMVIVGEPTDMTVVNAHKSIHGFITEVHGIEAHSSVPHLGVNAVMIAAALIGEINTIAGDMRDKGDPTGRFDPAFTSVHVGTVEGGTALNIVPKYCRFHWEFRGLPGQDENEIPSRLEAFANTHLLSDMMAVSADAGIETHRVNDVPMFLGPDGSPAESLALQLAQQNEIHSVSYGTEAGLFQAEDIPTIICGPGHIEQAHKPDEFISTEQIARCEAFMRRLIKHLT
jgi:acetylornithine deacetylase